MKLLRVAVTAIVVLAFATAGLADDMMAPEKGFRADMTKQMKTIQGKIIGLANETPADKLSWRPAEGVRSFSEVYAHVAAANYFLLSLAGVSVPEGVDIRNMEKDVTSKDDLLKALDASYDFLYKSINGISDEDLERAIKLFGQDANVRMALLICIEHNSEHLGQLIAYARSNGIVPPWSKKPAAD